jgi:hypothetical protein
MPLDGAHTWPISAVTTCALSWLMPGMVLSICRLARKGLDAVVHHPPHRSRSNISG